MSPDEGQRPANLRRHLVEVVAARDTACRSGGTHEKQAVVLSPLATAASKPACAQSIENASGWVQTLSWSSASSTRASYAA